ncbi:MAG: PBP1A family penicillin-binding protein [Betaproteobacteria bacterium]|nr:PBP1A family penicillin-binding protein [Betaproteobacteria bacterium]
MAKIDLGGPLALLRFLLYLLVIPALAGVAAALAVALAAVLVYPELPPIDRLTDYHPQIPLRVYASDGSLIGEFGEEHRALVKIGEVPAMLKDAILSAEDARFYQHGAIDFSGVLRSAFVDTLGGAARQGASTITMQLARNLYFSREKTLLRKFAEALLAYKIEHALSKDEILERYVNQIYLGERAYGFAAAAQVYFGKPLGELTLGEEALLAGLPKAPSAFSPRANPAAAARRRAYVLGRMRALGYIDAAQYRAALAEPIRTVSARTHYALNAAYVAEQVRRMMFAQYGEAAYTSGYSVYTTIHSADQEAADAAVRAGVLAYDRRHGYRGAEAEAKLGGGPADEKAEAERALSKLFAVNGLEPAVVLHASSESLTALMRGGRTVRLEGEARKFGAAVPRLERGAIIRLDREAGQWRLAQLPRAQAALVALDPTSGAILALCGGFDFDTNQFDHVTQAYRQPGSSFKPFVYSAALEKGYSPASIVQDTPLVVPASYPGGEDWAPHNYENDFLGPITVREALADSRNVAAVRVLLSIGIPYARDYVRRFGLPKDQIPPYPTMVLGSGSFTPLQMATAYAVFANGGYRVEPYLVDRVLDAEGRVIYQANPARAGADAPRVIDARNAFLMTSLLQSVVRHGTAARAQSLGRRDLAGKTGTTENFVDAWFDGYNPDQVAVAWIGFDQPRTLGNHEAGARAALPVWMDYMRVALKDAPDHRYPVPPGVVQASVALPDDSGSREGVWNETKDYFYAENAPPPPAAAPAEPAAPVMTAAPAPRAPEAPDGAKPPEPPKAPSPAPGKT